MKIKSIVQTVAIISLAILSLSTYADKFEPYGLSLCKNPQYKCIYVGPHTHWSQLFPNEEQRQIVMRLNRFNMALKYRDWLVVPKHWKDFSYLKASPFPQQINATGKKMLYIDLRVFAFAAYDANGKQIYWGPATGGRDECVFPDGKRQDCKTITGVFRIYRKRGENCVSSKYPVTEKGGAAMPYCMFFMGGYAIHGSDLSGFRDTSHGCVRLFKEDARWLNEDFAALGTKVVIAG